VIAPVCEVGSKDADDESIVAAARERAEGAAGLATDRIGRVGADERLASARLASGVSINYIWNIL